PGNPGDHSVTKWEKIRRKAFPFFSVLCHQTAYCRPCGVQRIFRKQVQNPWEGGDSISVVSEVGIQRILVKPSPMKLKIQRNYECCRSQILCDKFCSVSQFPAKHPCKWHSEKREKNGFH